MYLQQDVLTSFLTADTEQDRFEAISELIGAGRTAEFRAALERSRRAWSSYTTQRSSELKSGGERLSQLEGQLRELLATSSRSTFSADEWTTWWSQARSLGVSVVGVPRFDSSDAQRVIDVAMAELRARRLSLERRGHRLRDLVLNSQARSSAVVDIDALHAEVEEASQSLEAARRILTEAEEEVAEARRRQREIRSDQEDLRVLAEVAFGTWDPIAPFASRCMT